MSKRKGRRTRGQEQLARVRIQRLFRLAEMHSLDGKYFESKRFIELAKLISKRYNQRLTKTQRIKICKDCNSFLTSKNSTNRISSKGWKIITCLDCGKIWRHSLLSSRK